MRIIIAVVVIAIILILIVFGIDKDSATRVVALRGISDINITTFKPFDCNWYEIQRAGFTGIDIDGHNVEGVVCSGRVIIHK